MPETNTVAVMQPYFYPYPTYFALLAIADTFVLYDCVQFPRRGRVHRTQLSQRPVGAEWLTLPLLKQERGILIRDLAFRAGATEEFQRRLRRSSSSAGSFDKLPLAIQQHLTRELVSVVDFLEEGLRVVATTLGFQPNIVRSSSLRIGAGLRGQERVIAIVKAAGGERYVNAPGGRVLYDPEEFRKVGLELQFLPSLPDPTRYMLPALAGRAASELAQEIRLIAASAC